MKPCVLYCRFSPRPNAKECESIEAQLHDLRLYAGRQGYTIVDEFGDAECSGDDEERPGLWQAMEALKRGYTLLVWKGDRLARSVYLSEYLHRDAASKGAAIEYLNGRNGDGPDDVLVRQILAAVDEHRKKVDAVRTRYMMLSHQARGRRMSAKPPFGMMVDATGPVHKDSKLPARMIECPEEQDTIARILELHAGHGLRAIGRMLESEGRLGRCKPWHHKVLATIIERNDHLCKRSP